MPGNSPERALRKRLTLRPLWRSKNNLQTSQIAAGSSAKNPIAEMPRLPGARVQTVIAQQSDIQSPRSEARPLDQLRLCVAIDNSGSTWGEKLKQEVDTALSINEFLSPRNESPMTVIPWNDSVGPPITLPRGIRSRLGLVSGGGTNPAVLYASPPSLNAISSSSLWFLLTDGEISDDYVQKFAFKTSETGIHGIACVVVCFGSQLAKLPVNCDISVGIALFAVSPHCLFLFHDTDTGRVSILQAKGCFNTLLPKEGDTHMQPELNEYTSWGELPSIKYNDLATVLVPPPRHLTAKEIALQGDMKVNVEDLYAGVVSYEDVGAILRDEDNLKSLIMAETTRGHGPQLQSWFTKQQKSVPTLSRDRPDIGGRAQKSITELLQAMGTLDTKTDRKQFDKLRKDLRKAHEANKKQFLAKVGEHREEEFEAIQFNDALLEASSRSTAMSEALDMDDCSSYAGGTFERVSGRSQGLYRRGQQKVEKKPDFDVTPKEMFYPGFKPCFNDDKKSYSGKCMLCGQESILALLMKAPPKLTTPNFPTAGSHSALAYPLAMSNFAETDCVSFFICCDSCAVYLVRTYKSPYPEIITGALPLADFTNNKEALLDVMAAAVKDRFQKDDLILLFMGILDRMVTENETRTATSDEKTAFRGAGQWAIAALLDIAVAPMTLSMSFANETVVQQPVVGLTSILTDKLVLEPGDPKNSDIILLRYPVAGFVTLLRLIRDQGLSQDRLHSLLFQRLVYCAIEMFFRLSAERGTANVISALDKVLHSQNTEDTLTPKTFEERPTSKVTLQALQKSGLLNDEDLAVFEEMIGFAEVKNKTEPAMAVFLFHLAKFGESESSPVACFNAMKRLPTMREVLTSPLAVSEAFGADLMSDLGG